MESPAKPLFSSQLPQESEPETLAEKDVREKNMSGQARTPMVNVFYVARATCENMYTTAFYTRQKCVNESKSDFDIVSKHLFSRVQAPRVTCNTCNVLITTHVVDCPWFEHPKDARTANIEPIDLQARWQHAVPNSNYLQPKRHVYSIDEKFRPRPHFHQPPTAVQRLMCIVLGI